MRGVRLSIQYRKVALIEEVNLGIINLVWDKVNRKQTLPPFSALSPIALSSHVVYIKPHKVRGYVGNFTIIASFKLCCRLWAIFDMRYQHRSAHRPDKYFSLLWDGYNAISFDHVCW